MAKEKLYIIKGNPFSPPVWAITKLNACFLFALRGYTVTVPQVKLVKDEINSALLDIQDDPGNDAK